MPQMTRPPVFHDRRSREDRRDDLLYVAKAAALVIVMVAGILLLSRCAPANSVPPLCQAIAKLQFEGWEAEDKAGCSADPEKLCPEIVAEYDRKIEAVPESECP